MMKFSEQLGEIPDSFFVMATRVSFGNFYFESSKIDNITFPNIRFTPDTADSTNVQCLTGVNFTNIL